MMLPTLPATLEAVDEITQWIAALLDTNIRGDHEADPSRRTGKDARNRTGAIRALCVRVRRRRTPGGVHTWVR